MDGCAKELNKAQVRIKTSRSFPLGLLVNYAHILELIPGKNKRHDGESRTSIKK